MLSLLRLERKQKNLFKSIWNSHISLSFLLTWNRNDKYVHTHRSSLGATCIPVFRPKRRKNLTRWGGTYLYGLYKGVPPGQNFLNPLNDMQMSTRQFTPSSGHASTFSTRTARTTRLPLHGVSYQQDKLENF